MSKESDAFTQKLMKAAEEYLRLAKKADAKVTRDEVIAMITQRLGELIKENQINGNKERMWVASGMAAGLALSLLIELKLEE